MRRAGGNREDFRNPHPPRNVQMSHTEAWQSKHQTKYIQQNKGCKG